MKKTAVITILLLCIAAVLTAGCITDEPAEPIDYPTALVGDWKSVDKTSYGDREFYVIYHFNDDNTGTVVADVNGKAISTIDVFWGYVEDNGYIVGYTTTGKGEYLYISEDGMTLVNEFGETFKKI